MPVADVIMKNIGVWLLAVIEIGLSAGAYLLGHFVDHIPAEIAVMIASLFGATQLLLFACVKYKFKLTDEEVENRAFKIKSDREADSQ